MGNLPFLTDLISRGLVGCRDRAVCLCRQEGLRERQGCQIADQPQCLQKGGGCR